MGKGEKGRQGNETFFFYYQLRLTCFPFTLSPFPFSSVALFPENYVNPQHL